MGLYTELVGTGRPRFAFLHGLFGRGRNFTGVAHALSEAGQGSVLFDLPNHGRSPWTERFDYREMAAAVAAEISERLGSSAELILVGHSMGGKVAMLTALEHPDLVSGLVVVDIAPGRSEVVDTFTPLVAAMRSLDLSALESRAEAEELLGVRVRDPQVRQFLLQNLRRKGGWHWQHNLGLLGTSLAAIGDWPPVTTPPYAGPVLWLAGERSDYVRDEHDADMARLFPNVAKVVVPGAGHWLHADAPEAFLSELLGFAARVDDPRG